jgi:hypothetical protein
MSVNQCAAVDDMPRGRRRAARATSAVAALLAGFMAGGRLIGGCGASAGSTQTCAGPVCAGAGGAESVESGVASGGTSGGLALAGAAGGGAGEDAGVGSVESGLVVTIANERRSPIYMYPSSGCYDPLETVVALVRPGEWVDVFGTVCESDPCGGAGLASSENGAGLDAGGFERLDGGVEAGSAEDAGSECVCPFIGMVKLDAGATLVIGPLVDEFLRGVLGPSDGAGACGKRPLPAGEYTLEVDAMSGLDPDCGAGCDCVPDASGVCATRGMAGDGVVLNQTKVVRLPAREVSFTFSDD